MSCSTMSAKIGKNEELMDVPKICLTILLNEKKIKSNTKRIAFKNSF